MKKFVILLSIIGLCLCLSSCGKNESDCIEIYGESSFVFDNILIEAKEGYFYKTHEKFTVDENTIGITVYFSNTEEDEWESEVDVNND